MERKDLLIGIDLGTSWTAIATSKEDHRAIFQSVVGYPKDIIGAKILGGTYIVGEEALQKSFLNPVFPLDDGVIKESGDKAFDAARKLIEYAVELAGPEEDERICGVVGVPANASVTNRELVLALAEEVMDVALVVSEPFAVGYGMDKLVNCIVIDIGAGTSDICGLKGTLPKPDDQASMSKAGNFIDDLLMDSIIVKYPNVQVNKIVCRSIKEQHAFVGKPKEPVIVDMREEGKPVKVDLTDEIRGACEAIVPDIIEQVQKLIRGFAPEDQAAAASNIVLAGGGSRIRGLDQMIIEELHEYGDIMVTCVPDIMYSGAEGALKLATDVPPEYWGELGEVSA